MRSPMDQNTYLEFYKNTVLGYSKGTQYEIVKQLEKKKFITFSAQMSIEDNERTQYFENKNDFRNIITSVSARSCNAGFFELYEFTKLYKYSVPLFFSLQGNEIRKLLQEAKIHEFIEDSFKPSFVLNSSIVDVEPLFWEKDGAFFIKFVTQRTYVQPDDFEKVDYRYVVVIYVNPENELIDIRYDSGRYESQTSLEFYERNVEYCINWLKNRLGLTVCLCEHAGTIDAVKNKDNSEIVMYKQMMELNSGGAAELTAAESKDYVLPFVGEIRELIEENFEMFNRAEDVKKLLLNYLDDKEDTAHYTYIYIKWRKPVESNSFTVKITFDYLVRKYTLMQHITSGCKDVGMGRMNEAINYLCRIKAFVKGEEI